MVAGWKNSQFNICVNAYVEGFWLLFNSRTGRCLTLDANQERAWQHISTSFEEGDHQHCLDAQVLSEHDEFCRELIRGGFIVSANMDERAQVVAAYNAGIAAVKRAGNLSLTLAPTVSCNFRCGYCFQDHPKAKYSRADIDSVLEFVDQKLVTGTSLDVCWFGGEPLLVVDIIEELTRALVVKCEAKKVKFSHSIVTNGSLLTSDVVERLCALPKFGYLQVTLDGPAEIHDVRRHTVGRRGTFDTIVANIEAAARRLPISIRINVDKRNVAHVESLLKHLEERGLKGLLSFHLGHVEEFTSQGTVEGSALSREEFAAMQARFEAYLFQHGWVRQVSLPAPTGGPLCTVDNPNGFVISPGGLVFQCWNEAAEGPAKAAAHLRPGGRLDRKGSYSFVSAAQNAARVHHAAGDGSSAVVDGANGAYNPFQHTPCKTCAVQPLCKGGCPWEASKSSLDDTGHCTSFRWNLADRIRLWHLTQMSAGR